MKSASSVGITRFPRWQQKSRYPVRRLCRWLSAADIGVWVETWIVGEATG